MISKGPLKLAQESLHCNIVIRKVADGVCLVKGEQLFRNYCKIDVCRRKIV